MADELRDRNTCVEMKAHNSYYIQSLYTLAIAILLSSILVSACTEAFLARPENRYEKIGYLESFLRGNERHLLLCKGAENVCAIKLDFDRWILSGLHKAGVRLLLAKDSGAGNMGITPGYSIHDELRLLVENGFSTYGALLIGTVNAARIFEKMTGQGNFGTIEIGNRADLVLVSGNSLEDVATIREQLGVITFGMRYLAKVLGN